MSLKPTAELLQQYRQTKRQSGLSEVDSGQGVIGDVVDATQQGLYDGVAGIGEFVGLDGVRDWAKQGAQEQTLSMSARGREAMGKQFFETDNGDDSTLYAGDAWSDPRAIVMQLGRVIGMNADIVGGGAVVKGGRMAVTSVANAARQKMLQKGAPAAMADEVAKEATKTYLQRQMATYGDSAKQLAGDVFDYGTAGHAVSGGLLGIDIRDEVNETDFEQLAQLPEYKQLVLSLKQTNPQADALTVLSEARKQLGEQAASAIKTNPTLLTANMLVGGLGTTALTHILRGVMPKGAGIATELAVEGTQGAMEQVAMNQEGQRYVDADREQYAGVLQAGLNEAVMGGAMGATAAVGRAGYDKARAMLDARKQPAPAVTDEVNLPELPADDAELDIGADVDDLMSSDPQRVYTDRAAKVRKYAPDFVDRVTELVTKEPHKMQAAAATMDNYLASYDYGERAEARLHEYLNPDVSADDNGEVTLQDRAPTTPEQDNEDYKQLYAVTAQQYPDFAQKMQLYVEAQPNNIGMAADVMARYLAEPDFRPQAQARVDEYLTEFGYSKRNTNVLQQPAQQAAEPAGTERPEVEWARTFATEHLQVNGELPPADILQDTFDLSTAELDEILATVGGNASVAPDNAEPVALQVEEGAQQAATSVHNDLPEPTQGQIKAGNYKKGKVRLHGLDISVENPRGSMRKGTDPDGRDWEIELQDSYGYIRRTTGADNEQVDVFIGSYPESDRVFVVDQVNADGSFDEHKVVLGATNMDEAVETYSRNYEQGWTVGPVTEMSVPEFKNWLKGGDTKAPLQLEATSAPAVNSLEVEAAGQAIFDARGTATDAQIDSLSNEELRAALSLIGNNRYKGLDNVSKGVVRHVQKNDDVPAAEMRQVLQKHRDYWIERDRSFAEADAKEAETMQRRYGEMSLEQLEAEAAKLRSKAGGARRTGEVTDGNRSSVKATSNEAARSYAEEEMRLQRYIAERKQADAVEIDMPTDVIAEPAIAAEQALVVEDYSDKSIVVRGDTKAYKTQLKDLKGTFNPRLKGGEGWVFGKKREAEIRAAIDDLNTQSNTTVLQKEETQNVPDTTAGVAANGRVEADTNALGGEAGRAGRAATGQRDSGEAAAAGSAGRGAESGAGVPAAGAADIGSQSADGLRAGDRQRGAGKAAAKPAGKTDAVGNADDAGAQPDNSANRKAGELVTAGSDKPAIAAPTLTVAQVEQRLVTYLLPQYAKQTEDAKADPYMVAKALIERPATKTNFNREQSEYLNRNTDIAGYRALTDALNSADQDAVIAGLAAQVKDYRAEQALRIKLKGELDKKAAAQLKAESVPFVQGDVQNVRDSLPYLDPLQQDDVVKAEQRLYVQNERGMLLANGTGTGKTFSGGGVIKRAVKRGAKRVLVVSPAGMTNDWEQGLKTLQLKSAPLENTQDGGTEGVVALTSYENFYQNKALLDQPWDLLVYDESHKLMGNMQGDETQALNVHRMLSRYSDYSSKLRAQTLLEDDAAAIRAKIDALIEKEAKRSGKDPAEVARDLDTKAYWAPYDKKVDALAKKFDSWYAEKQTKTLFLSASPFATHHALFYMDGYIFDSKEGASTSQAYNAGNAQQQFLVKKLGYRMRYNKASRPEKDVDVGLLERELADELVQSGAMSIRRLEVEKDYSREFVRVSSALGQKLQQGFDVLRQPEFSHLHSKLRDVMKGGKDHELLEALRAKESIERIKQHLAMGRKVVVFHERQEISITHPFRFAATGDEAYMAQLAAFKKAYPELYNLPLTGLNSVPAQLERAFGREAIALFSGRNKKDRQKELNDFKDDAGSRKILVIQKQAGKEGISPHDVTGKHPRALMIMNTPVSPTDLIQMEGRVFRRGLASNAIIELPIIGTQFEMHRYRSVVSERTGTAENLAMGSQARDLRNVLREGYLDPRTSAPDATQGIGGKEADKKDQTVDSFTKAKTYYWKRAKKTSKNKAAEGKDYFATPEPIGLAMVRMADIKPGDKALEPSGGHGAIARWLPETATNVTIELSPELSPELAMVTEGKVIEGNFYDHHIVNKYHSIVMNPPFGHGGSDAIKFVEKGFKHLYNGGRMVAIIPRGKMDERINSWLDETPDAHVVAAINLPGNTFSRAGAGVHTRVLIIDKDKRGSSDYFRQIDLSSVEDINQLFEQVNEIDVRPRPDVTVTAKEVGLYQQAKEVEGKPLIEVSQVGRAKPGVDKKLLKKLAERFNGEVDKDWYGDTNYLFDQQKDANRFYEALLEQIEKTEAGVELDLDFAPALAGNAPRNDAGVNQAAAGKTGIKVPLDVGQRIATEFDNAIADSGRGTIVRANFAAFPQTIKELLQNTDLEHAKGFLFEGRVYINLQHIESVQDLQNTLVHERLRHYGVRKVFGADVFNQLQKIYLSLGNRKVKALADKYGVDMAAYQAFYAGKPNTGARILDEVLAHVTEADVPARTWGLIGELKTRLKLWVNKVFGEKWRYNEADVFNLIAISKRAVTGKSADKNGAYLQPHKERFFDESMADTNPSSQRFKKWFGDSKVVDADGRAKVMYHGTLSDFNTFMATENSGGLIFFTADKEIANAYATLERQGYTVLGVAETMVNWGLAQRAHPDMFENGALIVPEENAPITEALLNAIYDLDVGGRITKIQQALGTNSINPADAVREINEYFDKVKSGGNVMPVYLKAERPFNDESNPMPWFKAEKLGKEHFINAGFDSVYVTEGKGVALAVFNSNQIKSAIGNNGQFSLDNADIAASLGGVARKGSQAVQDGIAALQQTRLDGLAKVLKPSKVWEAIKLKWPDLRPAMLATLPRNYLGDIAGKFLPSLAAYNKQVAAMEAERNQLLSNTHETADAWRKLVSEDRKASEALAGLMHEATLLGVDPSHDEYKPNITPQLAKKLSGEAKAFIKSRNGEAWAVSRGMNRLERIKEAMEKEPGQRDAYPRLRAAFLALPAQHQAMFEKVRDDYTALSQQRIDAIKARIDDLIQDKRVSAAQIALMQQEFELASIAGVYFPLQRFGNYWAVAKDASTGETLAYSMFETNAEMQKWVKEQAADGVVTDGGYKQDYSKALDGVGAGFMKDLLKQMAPIFSRNDKLQDEVYQVFLQHSPELSMRKHMIHRKGVKGFDADALRAYAHNMFHGAYQVAKTKHTHHMQSHLMAMADEAKGVANLDDKSRATQVVNEMQLRNDWILNPQGSAFAAKMTGFGFFWYLGTSPAAALVNITQTPMIGLPVLGSRYGYKGAAKALLDASKAFIKGRGHVEKTLSGLELDAFKAFEQSGVIDKTQAHDVTGIADGGVAYSPRYHKVMKVAGFMFHHAERFNREVTAMAAYRLAFAKVKQDYAGKPANVVDALAHAKAVDMAMELVKLSHFDYANSNRARVIQSDAARVLLLFRQHSINMTYRLLRDFQQSFWGAPEDKAQARKQLAGILGIGLLFSGAAGLPLYSVVAGIFNTLGGDEDEPFNFDHAVRAALTEAIGETAASLVMNGTAGTMTGADLTGRIGMNNLWFREPDVTLEGEAVVQYYAEQALGPMFGIATGWGRAAYLANQGDTARAWEAAVPKFARDWFKSVRFAQEGVLSRRGDAILDELSPWQIALQANGFTPLELSEQYKVNSHVKTSERVILERRKLLMNRYALGKRLYDADLVDETLDAIERFNEANPTVKITAADRVKSLKLRSSISERAVNGVVVSKKLAHLQQQN